MIFFQIPSYDALLCISSEASESHLFMSGIHAYCFFNIVAENASNRSSRSPISGTTLWEEQSCHQSGLRLVSIDHEIDTSQTWWCYSDPLPWQCLTRYKSACQGVTFVDIDYPELMAKKRDVVQSTAALNSMLANIKNLPGGKILFRSDEYIQLGCDLRDLNGLEKVLSSVVDIHQSLILFTAEVSITYMDLPAADALIKWAATLPHCLYLPPTIYSYANRH